MAPAPPLTAGKPCTGDSIDKETGSRFLLDVTLINVFGPEIQQIEVGSSSSGTLERHEDRHVHVDSTYKLKKITNYVSARTGKIIRSDETWDFQNTYSWRESALGTTDVWELVTAGLPGPTEVVVKVRGRGFTPIATLFRDASPRLLTFKDGL